MSVSLAPFTILFPFDHNAGVALASLLAVLTISFAAYGIVQLLAPEKSNRDWKQQGFEILFVFLIPFWIGHMTVIRCATAR